MQNVSLWIVAELGCKLAELGCKLAELGCKLAELGCKLAELGCKYWRKLLIYIGYTALKHIENILKLFKTF